MSTAAKTRTPQTAPPVESAAALTRSKLLEAGAEIFAEVGYDRATIRQICARAGVNISLVRYYFGDKLELYTEVLRHLLSKTRIEALRTALQQDAPPEEVLRNAIRARLRGICSYDQAGRIFRILAYESAQPTPAMTRIVDEVSRPLYERMCGVLGSLLGTTAADPQTRLCAHSVIGQVLIYILASPMLSRLWPDLQMTPEQVDRIADHIANFSLAYLRQEGGRRKVRQGPERRNPQ